MGIALSYHFRGLLILLIPTIISTKCADTLALRSCLWKMDGLYYCKLMAEGALLLMELLAAFLTLKKGAL